MCILAHSYIAHEITEIADFVGDSYALSVKTKSVFHHNVLMCGVRFMAETCKILSPQKEACISRQSHCRMPDGRTDGQGTD